MNLNTKKDRIKTCEFFTFGCKVNQYETQLIREQFLKNGFIETEKNPDYYIVNGCTVTASADRKCRSLLRTLHKKNPRAKIIITGCFAKNNPQIVKQAGISHIVAQDDKLSIIDLLGDDFARNYADFLPRTNKKENNLKKTLIHDFAGHSRVFVKIQDGCDNFCSYCIVPHMRGLPVSKDIEVVKQEVSGLAKKGFKEIVLTGINLGMWGSEPGRSPGRLPELLKQLGEIEHVQRLRLSSVELIHVDGLLIEQLKENKKLCGHLHIPLQSGDDSILQKMNRRYNRALFLEKIKQVRESVSDICFTTDIMVGFPGETEANFNNTLDLVKKAGFLKVHVFPFSPRQGTLAAQMPEQVDKKVKNNRKKILAEFAQQSSFELRKKMLNNKLSVLFEESTEDGYWLGYSDSYVPVKLKSDKNLKNRLVPVIITGITSEDTIAILDDKQINC